MPLRVLVGDDDVELLREPRKPIERQCDRSVSLRRHDPESSAFGSQTRQHFDHPAEGLEGVVKRVVVDPIGLDELVDAVGVERLHLRDEALAAHRRRKLLIRKLTPRHRADGMVHGREDDRPGVDQRAVEIEEDDGEAHRIGPRLVHRAIVARRLRQ